MPCRISVTQAKKGPQPFEAATTQDILSMEMHCVSLAPHHQDTKANAQSMVGES